MTKWKKWKFRQSKTALWRLFNRLEKRSFAGILEKTVWLFFSNVKKTTKANSNCFGTQLLSETNDFYIIHPRCFFFFGIIYNMGIFTADIESRFVKSDECSSIMWSTAAGTDTWASQQGAPVRKHTNGVDSPQKHCRHADIWRPRAAPGLAHQIDNLKCSHFWIHGWTWTAVFPRTRGSEASRGHTSSFVFSLRLISIKKKCMPARDNRVRVHETPCHNDPFTLSHDLRACDSTPDALL